jgi:tetratricopeptide (TPR) repeat protein
MNTARLDQMLKFVEDDPNDSFSRYAVALEYAGMKDYDRAIDYLTELRRRDPDYVAAYYQLGQAYAAVSRWDEAEEAYNQGIVVGRKLRDLHTVSELQAALDELDTLR